MENNKTATLTETIEAAVAEILKTGNSAPKVYLRVRPNGSVDVTEETSWCCSPDEYYKRVPHTLSLEVLASTRNYSSLSEDEIEECADNATEGAEEIVAGWQHHISEWVAAGNLDGVEATETDAR
jgi:flagellar biosynthesis/type III secretory pathway protein FliH